MLKGMRVRKYYPWEDWTNGRVWRVCQGQDFLGRASTFRSTLYRRAQRQGLRCRVHEENPSTLVFQFFANGEPAPADWP